MTTPIKSSKHIMILAGEPSGDIYAGRLARELRQMKPDLVLSGIGGQSLKKAGVNLFYDIENLTVMGLVEVFSQIRYIKQAFDLFRHHIKISRPNLLILIDYPGFNLKAAAVAKQQNIPVLYYIPPKVWAWKKSRLKKIKYLVNHVAFIFPFEYGIYKKAGIPATFVGNPLLDDSSHSNDFERTAPAERKASDPFVIGLLPGSRKNEIKTLLHIMLESAALLQNQYDKISFLVSAAESVDQEYFHDLMKPFHESKCFTIIHGDPAPVFLNADLLIAASGTVTLEAAIHAIPTIIIYKVAPLTFFMGKHLVQLDHVGLANILAGKQIMPELLQTDATPMKICRQAMEMLTTGNLLKIKNQLGVVNKLLGEKGAAKRTARIAIRMMD